MLHMVISSHNPESCGFHPHLREAYSEANAKLMALAKEKGVTIQGMWINPPEHLIFALVDAPSAHAILEIMMGSGQLTTQTVKVHAVIPGEQASQAAGITPPQ